MRRVVVADAPVVVLFIVVVEIVARLVVVVLLEESLCIQVQIIVILLNISIKPTEVILKRCVHMVTSIAVMV